MKIRTTKKQRKALVRILQGEATRLDTEFDEGYGPASPETAEAWSKEVSKRVKELNELAALFRVRKL